jgi:type II secretory pathway component PulF
VPILRALSTISEQTESAAMGRVVDALRRRVQDGGMLSDALQEHPKCFPAIYVSMVRAGESAGALDTVLLRLAETRERDDAVRRQVQTAMAYPTLIMVVGAATVFVLLAFFLPRVAGLFRDVRDLPLPTRMLLGISDAIANGWPWMLLAAGLALAVLNRILAMDRGRLAADRLKLRMPGVGKFLLHADLARLARTLGLLLESGVAIDRSLGLCAGVVRNRALKIAVEEIRTLVVQQGLGFASGVRRAKLFPPLFANMTAVGEEAGALDAALLDIASFYERDCEQRGRMATSLLEPVMILVVGALVGFIVAAMLLPVFRLTSGL